MRKNDSVLDNYQIGKVNCIPELGIANFSIDAGSTETRTHMWTDNPKGGTVHGISAGYSVLKQDISGTRSQSDSLYDNLEICIEDLTVNKETKVFDKINIVKGGLLEDLRLPVARTSSNTSKGLQETTYVNAIANIALRVYMAALTTGSYYQNIEARVTLALPQEDITSTKRQEEIKAKLAGEYMVTMPRCPFAVAITIKNSQIVLIDEAQAVLGFWRINNKEKAKDYNSVLIIDAGGRSVDLSIMLNGRVLARGSLTGKFGGQKFIDLITEKYINETGNEMPTRDMVLDALDTGLLQDGNSTINIADFIEKSKAEIASNIENDVTALLDLNELRMKQLNLVLCAGRMMGTSENAESSVQSLTAYTTQYVISISPNTDVGKIDDEFALVKGLSLARAAYNARKK